MADINRRKMLTSAVTATAAAAVPAAARGIGLRPAASADLLRYREVCAAEYRAQKLTVAAYDAWVAEHAPDLVDYTGLFNATLRTVTPADGSVAITRHALAWATFKKLEAATHTKPLEAEWTRLEKLRAESAAALIARRPTSVADLAETVEVLRTQWVWQPAHDDAGLTGIGCADDIEALLASVETLAAQGGAHG